MRPTGLVVEGWPARPGKRERGGRAAARRRATASSASPERRTRPGTSSASAIAGGDREQREDAPEVAERAAEARVAHERDDRARGRSRAAARTPPSRARGRRARRRARAPVRWRRPIATARRARSLPPADLQRPGDHGAEREQADGGHHREQQYPARAHEARRRGALAERRDHELRRRARARPDRERERPAHGMPVGRDHAPPHEVPALRDAVQRARRSCSDRPARARRAARDLLLARGVGDGDDGEARLDALAVGEADLGRRLGEHAARLRLRREQRGVSPRHRRHRERNHDGDEQRARPPAGSHAVRLPATSPTPPTSRPSAPTTSAMIAIVLPESLDAGRARSGRRRDARRGRVGGLGARPFDDAAVGVGLAHVERVRRRVLGHAGERQDGEARAAQLALPGDRVAAGELAVLLLLARDRGGPAGRRGHALEVEAVRDRDLDLGRGGALLLVRDGQLQQLAVAGGHRAREQLGVGERARCEREGRGKDAGARERPAHSSAIHGLSSRGVGYGMESAGGPRARRARASSQRGRARCQRGASACAGERGARLQQAPQDADDAARPRERVAQGRQQRRRRRARARAGSGPRCGARGRRGTATSACACRRGRGSRSRARRTRSASRRRAGRCRAPKRARARRGAGPGASSSACRSRTPSAASQSSAERRAAAAVASATDGDHGRRGPPSSPASGVGVAA